MTQHDHDQRPAHTPADEGDFWEAFYHDTTTLEDDEPCPRQARGETCTDCPA